MSLSLISLRPFERPAISASFIADTTSLKVGYVFLSLAFRA